MHDEIVRVENLKTYFPIRGGILQKTVGYVKAVDRSEEHTSELQSQP